MIGVAPSDLETVARQVTGRRKVRDYAVVSFPFGRVEYEVTPLERRIASACDAFAKSLRSGARLTDRDLVRIVRALKRLSVAAGSSESKDCLGERDWEVSPAAKALAIAVDAVEARLRKERRAIALRERDLEVSFPEIARDGTGIETRKFRLGSFCT